MRDYCVKILLGAAAAPSRSTGGHPGNIIDDITVTTDIWFDIFRFVNINKETHSIINLTELVLCITIASRPSDFSQIKHGALSYFPFLLANTVLDLSLICLLFHCAF